MDIGSASVITDGIVLNGGAAGQFTLTTTNDSVRFNGAVELQTDVRVDTGSGVGDVLFTNDASVDSQFGETNDLVIDVGTGRVLFNEDLGGTIRLGALTVEHASEVVFGQADDETALDTGPVEVVNTSKAVDIGSASVITNGIVLNGGGNNVFDNDDTVAGDSMLLVSTLGDDVRFNGAVTLESDVVINTVDNPAAPLGHVRFAVAAPVASQVGEQNSLTMTAGLVTVEASVDTTGGVAGVAGGPVTINTDDLVIVPATGSINVADLGLVTIRTASAGRQIDLGTNAAGKLGLTDDELDVITTGSLVIGHSGTFSPDAVLDSGTITVSNRVDPAGTDTLHLITAGQIATENGNGLIIETNLAIEADGTVKLRNANDVDVLAAAVSGLNEQFFFTDIDDLTVKRVDGVVPFTDDVIGLTTNDGNANVTTGPGLLLIDDDVTLGAGELTLDVGAGAQQAAGDEITAVGMELLGTGTITLVNANNDVTTLAADTDGEISYRDANGLTVGEVNTVGIVTDDDDVRIRAGSELTVADGAVIRTGDGVIFLNAVDDMTLSGRLATGARAIVRSTAGGIVDGGDGGGADISAPFVALRAVTGVGDGPNFSDAIDINGGAPDAVTFAVENTTSGSVQINSGGDATVGSVQGISGVAGPTSSDGIDGAGGLSGVTNTGGGHVVIVNSSPLTVADDIVNSGGGDTSLTANGTDGDLTINARIANLNGEGSIEMNAGNALVINDTSADPDIEVSGVVATIVGRAVGEVDVDPDALIGTGTGQISYVPVHVELVAVDRGGSDVSSLGDATVLVTMDDSTAENYEIHIDWSDGTIDEFPPQSSRGVSRFDGSVTYAFDHNYRGNPDPGNPSAPIPTETTVAFDPRFDAQGNKVNNGIEFYEQGKQNPIVTISRIELTVPGEGLFAFIKVEKVQIVPVEFRRSGGGYVIASQASSASQESDAFEMERSEIETTLVTELRVLFRRVDAAGKEGDDVDLPEEVLEGMLEEVFQKFPNGFYRVYLQEAGSERVRSVRDVHVYQGRVVTSDFRENVSERQPGGDQETAPKGEPVEATPGDAKTAPPKPPADDTTASATPDGSSMETTPETDEAAASVKAGVAVGAGLGAYAMRGRWADQVDRAFEAGPHSLSTAARLYRRIRRKRTRH